MTHIDDHPAAIALAGELSSRAVAELGDPLVALAALMTAASSVCLVALAPSARALEAFDVAAGDARERLVDVLGAGETRQ